MKKIVGVCLFFALTLGLTACGNGVNSSDEQGTTQVESQEGDNAEQKEQASEVDYIEMESTEQKETQTQINSSEESNGLSNQSSSEVTTEKESEELAMSAESVQTKTLVVYFSCTGTTETIAEYASDILGADIYEITPEEPYTTEDLAYYTNGRADREQDDPDVRPAINGAVENFEQYQTIMIGYPIWHGQAPRIISTFLESYDFSGKTLIPFCTSHSSGIGSSASNLHALTSNANWVDGMRFSGSSKRSEVENWLNGLQIKAE